MRYKEMMNCIMFSLLYVGPTQLPKEKLAGD